MSPRRISRRNFVTTSAATAGAMSLARPTAQSRAGEDDARRPNIVYIMADQQHWQAMGCVNSFYDTPSLDAFAADAALFERAFCTTPQCSPSRSSMLTGLYPSKTGVMGNTGATGGEKLAMPTIGAMLQDAGYATGYFGKWHLGNDPVGNAGWDTFIEKGGDPAKSDQAIEYVESVAGNDRPFAMIVSYRDPHDVYHFLPEEDKLQDPDTPLSESWHRETFENKPPCQKEFMTRDQGTKIWGRDKEVWQAYREFYREKVRLYDEQVGRVLQAIRDAGEWDNTIIIIGSDHGDMDTNHRLIFKGPFMYEHMMRVPLMVRVPEAFGGTVRGTIADYDTVNVDLVPTIRDFVGLGKIETDGLSLKPLLTGEPDPPKREFVIGQYYSKQKWVNPMRTIRTAEFKLNRTIEQGDELYDLVNDPEEIVNLSGNPAYAATEARLVGELDRWIEENSDPFYSFENVALVKGFDAPVPPRK